MRASSKRLIAFLGLLAVVLSSSHLSPASAVVSNTYDLNQCVNAINDPLYTRDKIAEIMGYGSTGGNALQSAITAGSIFLYVATGPGLIAVGDAPRQTAPDLYCGNSDNNSVTYLDSSGSKDYFFGGAGDDSVTTSWDSRFYGGPGNDSVGTLTESSYFDGGPGTDSVGSQSAESTFVQGVDPITLTGTTQNLNVTFGTTGYDTVTATDGTGTKTFTRTSNPGNAGITLNTSVTNQAVLIVASGVPSGTYYETITATDAASVTATFPITVTVTNPNSSDTDSAMVFNGSTQYATASGDVAGFDIANAISIEAWIYPTGANRCHGNIVVKAFSYYLYCDTGILYYALTSTNSLSGGVSTGITIPVNQWSHIAVTRAASTNAANVYVDGILQYSGTASSAGTSALYNSTNLFNIGARDAGANFFAGQIDEVKLWNVVRSASDVLSDLKTYGGSLSSGLVAYYDFNDLYGTYLVNRSTGGSGTLNLTVANSPTLSSSVIFTTTTSSPYSITSFTRNYLVANNGWKSPSTSKIKYLIVAGGGGGGAGYEGGGGGAGGYLESTTSITANTYYPIVVGVGGRGGLKIYGPTNGETSTAFSITAFGGGRGGTEQQGMSGPNATGNLGARQSGGSGGGGSHGSYTDVTGASGTSGQGSSGGAGLSNGAQFVGGGGGGASAVGGSATVSAPGSGGAGKTSTITGSSVNLAGGGGGSGRSTSSLVGTASFGGGAGAIDTGTSGTTNTGGGGGASTGSVYGISTGGSGGSGLIVLRYLTSNPTINLQPTNDTTTAGLTDSMTVGTTTISSPFSKSVKWQVATDTVTAVGSVLWADVASGTGFTTDTFTTSTLTTAMNKYRYRAIVTFSDSDSLTVVETSTVATLTINPAITITSSTAALTGKKYGEFSGTRTVTFTGGTDTRTVSASALSLAGGKITFDTATATFTFGLRTPVGTYLDTITITDAKGATASYVQSITYVAADTLTVTSDTPTALTYTGSVALFTETITAVSGLVPGDVISGATYNYSASVATCAAGGLCSIGQTGPGGGLVFITPTTTGNTTGKYFEAAPSGWSGSGTDPTGKYCSVSSLHSGALGTAIGTGEANTTAMAADCVSIADTATALVLNGKDDWFIPSFDELKEMYSKLFKATPTSLGGFTGVNYWSSSDHPTTSGWALQGWFGSSDGISGWNESDEANPFSYRPVRSFVATSTSTVNYGPSTTKPTNAATYTITPSALTFSSGDANNYVAVTYRTSTLTINKAAQAALTVTPLYNVFNANPTTATLLTTGGSDTGTVTYVYVSLGSTSSGCALSGADSSTVAVTSAGTCRIVATKAATNNYLVAVSDTGTVTFHLYVTNIPGPRAAEYPTEIVLSSAPARTNNGIAPTITYTGVDITKSPGGTITIAGSGFIGTRLVKVSGISAAFTVLSDTSLQITMPTGLIGISGPIYVEKAEGFRSSEDWVTGTA